MRARLVLVLIGLASSAWAAPSTGPALVDDPVLRDLVKDALDRRPELAQVRAQIAAEEERVPQGQVLPDPTLALGIQNDGFGSLQIGKMETSYLSIMASQTFPWAGKRGLRGEVAGFGARAAELDLQRVSLSLRAETERAYLDLLLVRDRMGLQTKLESLWSQTEALARIRYEAGEGSQTELLRAQLERSRLRQRRWVLEGEEKRSLVALNRLRGQSLDEPIATSRSLLDLPDPVLPDVQQATAQAEADSPELKKALLLGVEADRRVELAKRERWPDVTVSAGVMPRWGGFEPMWQAGVAFNVPVWSVAKQAHVVAENRARGQAARSGAEAVRQVLSERVRERHEALVALVETNRLYRSGVLVQSEATVSSSLAQYQVGRVSFASVFEAMAGHVTDVNGFFDSVVAAQQVDIAAREISLDDSGASVNSRAIRNSQSAEPSSGTSMSRM